MNTLGFFAVIIICATAIGITFIITRAHKEQPPRSISKKINIAEELEEHAKNAQFTTVKTNSEIEKEINEQAVAKASMDAVIKSCNELMGIETEEVEDDGKE